MESATPTKGTDETWSTRASKHSQSCQNNLVMHQMMSCHREVGAQTINQLALTFGTLLSSQSTDAHPSAASRPSWGQPDLRYRLTSTTPNRLGPAAPRLPWRRRVLRQLRRAEVIIRGVPRAVQSLRIFLLIRLAVSTARPSFPTATASGAQAPTDPDGSGHRGESLPGPEGPYRRDSQNSTDCPAGKSNRCRGNVFGRSAPIAGPDRPGPIASDHPRTSAHPDNP